MLLDWHQLHFLLYDVHIILFTPTKKKENSHELKEPMGIMMMMMMMMMMKKPSKL